MNNQQSRSLTTPPVQALEDPHKLRAREQWSANPCGAHVARDLPYGSREYFEAIEYYRYHIASRWMRKAIDFSAYSGKRLLEIGCGTGTDLLQFARGGALVTGLDLTPRSIEIARQRFEVYGQNGNFALGDAENLAFPDASFDAVYSFGVLHHTPDTVKAAAEVHRVLRPGCAATIMLYNRTSLYYWGSIILRRGIIGRDLLHLSPAEIMSNYVEYSETGGRPLVKAYSLNDARKLFGRFDDVKIVVGQLTRGELGLIGRALPDPVFAWLERHFGWNLLITAKKGTSSTRS
ncbi:MAG TPA: class I SAM-dependent methyltransferase [Blastocatellia bacterium]|nr:class I SAM-dependent methyltransferase [Blastocatellia bacterium]